MIEDIAKVFENNIGNRLTLELANGMIFAIKTIIKDKQAEEPEKANHHGKTRETLSKRDV